MNISMENKGSMKEILSNSFKELLKTNSIEKITIKEITDLAGVIRPTFYNHFQDKYEVLEYIVKEELLNPAYPLIHNGMFQEAILLIFTTMENDKEFYVKAVKVEGPNSFENIVKGCTEKVLLEIFNVRANGKRGKFEWLTPELITEYYAQSLCYILIQWLKSNTPATPREISEIYNYIIQRSMDDILREML